MADHCPEELSPSCSGEAGETPTEELNKEALLNLPVFQLSWRSSFFSEKSSKI
jgi:hypothetical protein